MTDQRAIEVLLLKGQQELQETMNCWKQTDHIYGILLKSNERPQRTFLQKFLEGAFIVIFESCTLNHTPQLGRDEDAVLPAASGVV